MITQEYIKSIWNYDPETGVVLWRYCDFKSNLWNSKYAGVRVGSIFESEHGALYWRVKMDGKNYLVHRLIWLYMTGQMPEQLVDHEDDNGLDNRWDNLRSATHAQNQANRDRPAVDRVGDRFRAKICVDYQQIHLGMYDTYEQAVIAYWNAMNTVHGEFAYCNRRQKSLSP